MPRLFTTPTSSISETRGTVLLLDYDEADRVAAGLGQHVMS
jgi:hypothetical protein